MRVAVIGAGAAGYFAAIQAARSKAGKVSVTLFEASGKPLSKVLISGGGRCNVTNGLNDIDAFLKHYPRGAKELRSVFHRFSRDDTVAWFEKQGVVLKTEADGRMFPASDSSHTIADCLMRAAESSGVVLRCKTRVEAVHHENSTFILQFKNQEPERFDRVYLCTGGARKGFEIAEHLGHTIVSPVPSLFSFGIEDPRLEELQGVSFPEVHARLTIAGQKKFFRTVGPLLITHWGLSGPAVIKLSSHAARELAASSYQAKLQLNLIPTATADEIEKQLKERKEQFPKRTVANDNFLPLPKRYWNTLIDYLAPDQSPRWAEVTRSFLSKLSRELVAAEYSTSSKGAFKDEFVTCGGVHLKEVDFRTMESKLCEGLYFAGEILNIDGITGGFNFQSAWSTGWIAGTAKL